MHKHVRAIFDECERWGVKVQILEAVPMRFMSPADDYVGLSWAGRKVFVDAHQLHKASLAPCVLHELSHVIFPKRPYDIDEVESGMLAYESYTATRLGFRRQWLNWMKMYITTDGSSWGFASSYRKRKDVELALLAANKIGIFDGTKPTYKVAR